MPSDRPATPLEVIQQLGQLTLELDRTVTAQHVADMDAATKRHAADLAEAKAFLRGTGGVEARRQTALVEVEYEEHEALVAEVQVRSLRRKSDAIKVRIDVGRTYGATLRAEFQTLHLAEG